MLYTQEELTEIIENKISDAEKKYGKAFKIALIELASLIKLQHEKQEIKSAPKLIELSKWNDFHAYPTVGALRQYYFKRDKNGFNDVCTRGGENGGRVLINEEKFFIWLEERKNASQVS